jgi:hypothetical protein
MAPPELAEYIHYLFLFNYQTKDDSPAGSVEIELGSQVKSCI